MNPHKLIAKTIPPSIDDLMVSVDDTKSATHTLMTMCVQIDIELKKIDTALNILQPQHTGKLRIEWWKRRDRRVPVAVQWRYNKQHQLWSATSVSQSKMVVSVRSSHTFRKNAPAVTALMKMAKQLMMLRGRALVRLAYFQRSVSHMSDRNATKILGMGKQIDDLLTLLDTRKDLWSSGNDASEAIESDAVET